MPADRLLNTVLQLYQSVHDDAKTNQIVGSTTSLLTTLTNPLNLGVLTSQLLIAPAIWHRRDGLRTSLRIISIYNTAAIRVRDYDLEDEKERHRGGVGGSRQGGGVRPDEWARAVVKGADDRSSRWQHLLVLTGVLMGMGGSGDRHGLSGGMRDTLEGAVVTAANLALAAPTRDGPVAAASIVLALTYAFPLLGELKRSMINCDELLPLTVQGVTGEEGFESGAFLAHIGRDVVEVGGTQPQLHWAPTTPSFRVLSSIEAKPLVGCVGPLSRLAAFAAERASSPTVALGGLDALMESSSQLLQRWQTNRLSSVDQSEESVRFTPDTLQATTPALWETFRKILYTTVTILQAVVSRSLLDPVLRSDAVAPLVADRTLRTLRNLFFIGSRSDNNAFQVYSFTYLTSLDILSRYPGASVAFLSSVKPPIPPLAVQGHPVNRTLDLFYLNIAEHLPLNITTEACDNLIVQPAIAYLSPSSPSSPTSGPLSTLSVELFESAHSAVLSALSCPHNAALTIRLVPFYIDVLFASFPAKISSRQFRVAFKTVMQIVSPPFPVAAAEPHMSETLLEMVRYRAAGASTAPLPPTPDVAAAGADSESAPQEPLSEQSALVITLVDALPFLPWGLVETWLAMTAEAMNGIVDEGMRRPVRERFLEVLVSGELDVERAAIGVAWWGTKGGRELVMGEGGGRTSRPDGPAVMSGAIIEEERASKL